MKKLIVKFILVEIVLIISSLNAQNQSTVPTYHWAYPYLHHLRLSGYLEELNTIGQPYTQAQVWHSLAILQSQIEQGSVTPSAPDQWLIELLMKQFQINKTPSDGEKQLTLAPGIWADESIHQADGATQFYTQLRSQVGLGLHENLYCYNGLRLDQSLLDDPGYLGKRWRGFAGYTEQAYVRFTNSDLRIRNLAVRFTLGRDFLNWGSGKTGRLLFSDHARPLDHLAVDFKYKGLQFTTIAADLDQWQLSDSLAREFNARIANRFLSAHRLTISFSNRLYLGLTEALLYGGPQANWELKYHNPLLYYHGELLNGGGYDGNGLLYLDVDWYPWRNWEIYGELLVDDIQLEKTGPGDMEPDQIGMILGFQHSDLFGLKGSLVGLEYVRIANRAYNSWREWEKFIHFNQPIGYYLGNNFDRWHFKANYFPLKGLQVGMEFDRIRKGEGSILDQWDTPWNSYTLAQGYDEPFPYGIVEKISVITATVKYHLSSNAMIQSEVRYQEVENFGHQAGKSQNNWTLFFKLHWDIGGRWYY